MEGSGFQNTKKTIFKRTEKMGKSFIEPGLEITSPNILAGVAAKTRTFNRLKDLVIY